VGDEVESRDLSVVADSVFDTQDDGAIVEDVENVNSRLGQSDFPDRLSGGGR